MLGETPLFISFILGRVAYFYFPLVINFMAPMDDPDVPPPQPSVNSISAWVPVNTLTVSMINSQMLLMSDFTKEYDDNAMVLYHSI